MAQTEARILGIDPSLRGTGYGVIAVGADRSLRALAWGVVKNPPALSHGACLIAIHDALDDIIRRFTPQHAANESTIYVQSPRIAITLGAARGAALMAVARHGLPLAEYAPKQVKAATTGAGAAGKSRIAAMVRALCSLPVLPPGDSADALAIAITHSRTLGGPNLASGKPTAYRDWSDFVSKQKR
jgi:crossover junction endodeoxyribonuclease RuvC